MKFFKKFLEYSRFSTGDFENIFKNMEVPSCPQVVVTLMKRLSEPDIEIDQIIPLLESDPALALQILKVANSALYALPIEVTTISKAVSLLGLKEIQNIAIGYAMTKALKDPQKTEFDFKKYWNDSILRAIFAKELASVIDIQAEEAFSASLLQDIAIPMLMRKWYKFYGPIFKKWASSKCTFEEVENELLSWNHAQAGAWIAKNWELPDIFTCCIGLHNCSVEEIKELGLIDTSVIPVAISSRLTALYQPEKNVDLVQKEAEKLGFTPKEVKQLFEKSKELLSDVSSALGL